MGARTARTPRRGRKTLGVRPPRVLAADGQAARQDHAGRVLVERARPMEGVAVTDERYPLISVLIPNYNYVKYVATAVESALAQTYPNLEVVVSDHCSTDGAWELLNERYGTDPRVRLHRNERNIGMARNFDRLMELARGRYVMCLSSDDFLFPPHLGRLQGGFRRDPPLASVDF